MKTRYFVLFVLLISFFVVSCRKEDDMHKDPKLTDEKLEVFSTRVDFSWRIDYPGKFNSQVEVSLNEDMSDAVCYGSVDETTGKKFSAVADNLKEATKYYYRFVVRNPQGHYELEEKSFVTKADVPKVRTVEVTEVTRTTAKVICEVTDDSGAEVTERGVCWDTVPCPTIESCYLNLGSSSEAFSLTLTDLYPGQLYYVRGYSINEEGIGYGEDLFFVTMPGPPVVITSPITNIVAKSAQSGGCVLSNGGDVITERGICWSTNHNPMISDYFTDADPSLGCFTLNMTGLIEGTTYFVRAYAINSKGISYGGELCFETLPQSPTGAINGIFSVCEGHQVYFSQGNLQYIGSSSTWKFADYQWDIIGTSQSSESQVVTRDLFGWGTSGWNSGNTFYRPYDFTAYDHGKGYGPLNNQHLYGSFANSDWGVYNKIINGGNKKGVWRTMSIDEWKYLLDLRQTSTLNGIENARFAKANVADVHGIILFPDVYIHPNGVTLPVGINEKGDIGWNGNNYRINQWEEMESVGAVFLPASGINDVFSILGIGKCGNYWSATNFGASETVGGYYVYDAYGIYFSDKYFSSSTFELRYEGCSVRLVRDCP